MSERKPHNEKVADLGLAAFLKTKNYKIIRVDGSGVFFEIAAEDTSQFHRDEIAYINSDFNRFDGLIMTLKRLPIVNVDTISSDIKVVDSLGQTAYMMMDKKWKIVGRTANNSFAFKVPMDEEDAFNERRTSWVNSEIRDFDAAIVAVKQLRLKRTRR